MNHNVNVRFRAGKDIPVSSATFFEQETFKSVASCVAGGIFLGNSAPVEDNHEIIAAAIVHAIIAGRHASSHDLPALVADELSRRIGMLDAEPSPGDIIKAEIEKMLKTFFADENLPESGEKKEAA